MPEIQQLDLPVDAITRVVPLADVEHCSWSGFRPIAIIPVDEFQSVTDSGTDDQGRFTSKTRQERVATVKILVALDPGSALALRQGKINELTTLVSDAERRASDLRTENEKLTKLVKELTERVDREQARSSASRTLVDEIRANARKMEADLGKVRDAVGQIRMKEILGS
jgi:hypothetical protein